MNGAITCALSTSHDATATGAIVTTGQGLFRTVVFVIPSVAWLTEKEQSADFAAQSSIGWNDTSNQDGSFVVSCTGDFFQDHSHPTPVRPCESSTAIVRGPGDCGV